MFTHTLHWGIKYFRNIWTRESKYYGGPNIPLQIRGVWHRIWDFKSPWFLISKLWFLISKLISNLQIDFWFPNWFLISILITLSTSPIQAIILYPGPCLSYQKLESWSRKRNLIYLSKLKASYNLQSVRYWPYGY